MKNFLAKNWAIIGWVLTVILDKSTGLVEHLVPNAYWQNFIYILGTGLLAHFWTSSYNVGQVKKQLNK